MLPAIENKKGILELAGEVIASHAERMRTYKKILENLKASKNTLKDVKNIELGRNVLRWIMNIAKKGSVPEKYTYAMVPAVKSSAFLYAPNDGQAIKVYYDGENINVRIKLPDNEAPDKGDWRWYSFKYRAYERLKSLLDGGGKIKKPRLRRIRVSSGVIKYVLDIVLEVSNVSLERGIRRFVAVDLGVRKLATLVLMDACGNQLSRPIFIRSPLIGKLVRIKRKISAIQRRIAGLMGRPRCVPERPEYYRRLRAELVHCWRRISKIVRQIQHHVSTVIVRLAVLFGADAVVFEDLRSYKPPKGRKELSWILSTAFMRKIIEFAVYKARKHGICVVLVDPRRTSRCCPRCGGLGFPVRSPRDLEACESGGFFYCPVCGFMSDRDYVGALNVGRAFVMGGRLVEGGEGSRYMPLPNPTGGRSPVGALPALCSAPVSLSPVGSWEGRGRVSEAV